MKGTRSPALDEAHPEPVVGGARWWAWWSWEWACIRSGVCRLEAAPA